MDPKICLAPLCVRGVVMVDELFQEKDQTASN